MRINNNISALRANTNLGRVGKNLDKSTEKLSSGYKINRASDDAAAFSISKRMRTQIKSLERASQNAADGISVIQTAEGALNEVSAMLGRMKELAVQAANDTNSGEDREAIQKEIDQLLDEIDRISTDSDFNTKTLLNGEVGRRSITNADGVSVIRASESITHGDYNLRVTGDPKKASFVGGAVNGGLFGDDSELEGSVKINGEVVNINKGDSLDTVLNKLRAGAERAGMSLAGKGADPSKDGEELYGGYTAEELDDGAQLLFVTKEYGEKERIDIKVSTPELAAALGLPESMDEADVPKGEDAKVEFSDEFPADFTKTTTISVNGDKAVVRDKDGFEMEIKIAGWATDGGAEAIDVKISVLDAGYMTLQIGANTGNSFDISIGRVDSETLGLKGLNIRTNEEAEKAITRIDEAIGRASAERAKLGAFQNRLEHTILSVDGSVEDLTRAFSRIMDTNMAEEMTKYTQYQVLSQAGTSVLAQANERPQTILTLLQG